MRPRRLVTVTLQKQAVRLHDPVHTLVIDAALAVVLAETPKDSGRPSIAVGAASVADLTDALKEQLVIDLAVLNRPPLVPTVSSIPKIRPRYTERSCHRLHSPSSGGNKGMRE